MNKLTSKQRILDILRENQNRFISGQEIADSLFITRAAVWKGIKTLEKEGFDIEAVTNRGYRLKKKCKINKESILRILSEEMDFDVHEDSLLFYEVVDSTNNVAREKATENIDIEAIIIAAEQTKGRGRRGRTFFSPEGTGIYMSYVFSPGCTIERATALTCYAACAVCQTIEALTEIIPTIKWVNDIYVEDKKVAGILTEAVTSIEDGALTNVIIGIGINLFEPLEGFPKEISKTAGAIFKHEVSDELVNKFCATLIYKLKACLESDNKPILLDEYRKHSFLTGNYVKIMGVSQGSRGTGNSYARVLGIDDDFHLLVEYDDGTKEALSTGEVSVVKY